MDSVQRISTVIPKFKYQLIFLKEREQLFQSFAFSIEPVGLTPVNSINSESSSTVPKNTESQIDTTPASYMINQTTDYSVQNKTTEDHILNEYTIPSLPKDLIEDIEAGAWNKFGPHFRNRQILIDAISYDLIEKYKILLV